MKRFLIVLFVMFMGWFWASLFFGIVGFKHPLTTDWIVIRKIVQQIQKEHGK